jgi:hypothetical protein
MVDFDDPVARLTATRGLDAVRALPPGSAPGLSYTRP